MLTLTTPPNFGRQIQSTTVQPWPIAVKLYHLPLPLFPSGGVKVDEFNVFLLNHLKLYKKQHRNEEAKPKNCGHRLIALLYGSGETQHRTHRSNCRSFG